MAFYLECNYSGDRWIYFDVLYFNVFGETIKRTPLSSNIRKDTWGYKVFIETSQELLHASEMSLPSTDLDFIQSISEDPDAIVRFDGSSKDYDYIISAKDKEALKDALIYYKALCTKNYLP